MHVRSGLLGQTKDEGSTPQQGERYKYSARILSGIIEVILNTVAIELEKATNEKKIELEKEFIDLVNLYESLEKHSSASAHISQTSGTRKGITQSTALDLTYKNELDSTKSSTERASFLATSGICQLFQTSFELYKHDATNRKLLLFVLNGTLCQIKSSSYVAKDDPLKGLIYGDIKVLGPPLLKLIWLIMRDQKKREAKGKKDNEDKRGLILLALRCLRELLTVSFQSADRMREVEDMLSDSVDVLDSECDHNDLADGSNNQREEVFMTKLVKPLFYKLLHAKLFHEVEVISHQPPCL